MERILQMTQVKNCKNQEPQQQIFCGSCSSSLVSLEVFSPAQILFIMQTIVIRHSVFLYFFILEFRNLLLSVPSVLFCLLFCSLACPSFYSFLLFFLFPVLFSPSVYSLYFLISLIIFFSNLLPFLFSFPITLFCLLLPYVLLLFNLFSFC